MYIRNLRKPSPNKNVFKFASAKVGEAIMCESTLEFDACFHHEYNEKIKHFGSQPEGFHYNFKGKTLPYTPDAVIHYNDGSVIMHEYKPYRKTIDPDFRAKFFAKKEAAKSLGTDLLLITEKQIRVYPLLDNLKILHRYSGIQGLNKTQNDLLGIIKNTGRMSVSELAKYGSLKIGEARSQLYSLINRGLLKADLIQDDLVSNPSVWCIA